MTASNETKTTSRADLHCHSTASQLSKLGVQRALGLPECATPPEEVYALAKRRGMDFVTITDHDTIDGVAGDRRPARRVRLRGADRALPRRAAGRARPLLRHHARRPRVAAGARRRRRGGRRRTCTSTRSPARWRTRSTRSTAPLTPRHRRRLARALPDLGGPQRLPRARAQPPAADLHRDARRHRRRRLRRPRRASTSGAP